MRTNKELASLLNLNAKNLSLAEDAKTRYKKNQTEIAKKIKTLQDKLKKHAAQFEKDNKNWGYVGDVGYINEQLDALQGFINN